MIWGMIGFEGPISLCKVEGTLNSQAYIDQILNKFVKRKFKNKVITF